MSGRRKSQRGIILVEVSLNKGHGEQKSGVKLDITSFICFVLLCIYWGVFFKIIINHFSFCRGKYFLLFNGHRAKIYKSHLGGKACPFLIIALAVLIAPFLASVAIPTGPLVITLFQFGVVRFV